MATGGATTAEVMPTEVESTTTKDEIVKLKQWRGVALWKYDLVNDICGICRVFLSRPCIGCETRSDPESNVDCKVAWGICGHVYHLHCITHWVSKQPNCPFDQSRWEVTRIGQ